MGFERGRTGLTRLKEEDIRRQDDRAFLVDMIQELVAQACGTDSMSISAYSDALRFLANEGRCRIVLDHGKRVIVEWTD
jgi:hypothetical protein